MAENGNAPQPAAIGTRTRVVLILSLALNLLFVGMLAGSGIERVRNPDRRAGIDPGMGVFAEALDAGDRRALRQAFLAEAPRLRAEREAWRAQSQQLVAALRAEPYDPAAVTAISRQMTAAAQGRFDLGARLLLARVDEMAASARLDFAERLEAALERADRRGRR